MLSDQSVLLLIDLQNDFCSGGALAVPGGEQVISVANALIPLFKTVIGTQDWHPHNHASFASMHAVHTVGDIIELNGLSQIIWPDHCVQNTCGAAFHSDLNSQEFTKVVQKGCSETIDSYSAFYDNHHLQSTGLTQWLKARAMTDIYIMGLATEYCVKYSCLDAIKDGFSVSLIVDGCRGIHLQSNDVQLAIDEMQRAGVRCIDSQTLLEANKWPWKPQ